jgi:hypothetical protein
MKLSRATSERPNSSRRPDHPKGPHRRKWDGGDQLELHYAL